MSRPPTFRVRLENLMLPPNVPAGMNVLVLMSLAYKMRGTSDDVEPVQVYRTKNGPYRIYDGRHRAIAALIAGRPDVLCRLAPPAAPLQATPRSVTVTEPKFTPGERVRITLEATYRRTLPGNNHEFSTPNCLSIVVSEESIDTCVERLTPANWPPQAGDVWSDESDCVTGPNEWHALMCYGSSFNSPQLRMLNIGNVGIPPAEFLRSYPNAKLVHKGLARLRAEEEGVVNPPPGHGEACTTWSRTLRHIAEYLRPRISGRSGATLCGSKAYDEKMARTFTAGRKYGTELVLADLPPCKRCAAEAAKSTGKEES